MANRFWVGGTDNWDGTAGTKWATTSGGVGGAAVPTSSDDVFFDGSSGSGTVTITATGSCLSLNFTGFTGTFAGSSSVFNYGNLTLGSGMSYTHTGSVLCSSTGTFSVTTNGVVLTSAVGIGGADTSVCNIQDSFSSTKALTINYGTFNTNNYNISCSLFSSSNSNIRTINLGSSTITLVGTVSTVWSMTTTTNLTFNCGTSTIKTTGTYGATLGFNGGGQTFNVLSCEHTSLSNGSNALLINGSNTFNTININAGASLAIAVGTTQTATTFTSYGVLGSFAILKSITSGSQATLSISSGIFDLEFLDIKDMVATGGATFNVRNFINRGNNTGWNFFDSKFIPLL